MKVDYINVFPEHKYSFIEWLVLTNKVTEIKKTLPKLQEESRIFIRKVLHG